MGITRYIADQFGNPTGVGGTLSTFVMNRMNRRQYRGVLDHLRCLPGNRVLDIGFGNGRLLRDLAVAHRETRFHGVETSRDMLDSAGKLCRDLVGAGRVSLQAGSVEHMPFDSGMFEWAYTVNTVYFWPDLDAGLREIHRVLRPGGVFLQVFYHRDWLSRLRYTRHGFVKYSPEELARACEACGFSSQIIPLAQGKSYCVAAKKPPDADH